MKSKNVKLNVLKALAEKPMKRKELCSVVLKINGRTAKTGETYIVGYYSDAFQMWEREGLIDRSDKVYKVTEFGKQYIENPKVLRVKNAEARKAQAARSLEQDLIDLQRLSLEAAQYADELHWDADRMSQGGLRSLYRLNHRLDYILKKVKSVKTACKSIS